VPIYGGTGCGVYSQTGCQTQPDCACEVTPSFLTMMTTFQALLGPLYGAIERFFPSTTVNSTLVAYVAPRITASNELRVRLIWTSLYPNSTFDVNSNINRSQLVDIYYALGMDWRNDKYLLGHFVPPPGLP
jgi:hypothetical protein